MTAVEVTPSYAGGSGPPLVLLHGITATWRIWQPIIDRLESRFSLFVPTLPGHHGGPALAAAGGGLPAMADAVEAALDERGLKTAHLAGNSLGGWLVLELARRGRAETVTALSPAGAWRNALDVKRVVTLLSASGALLDRVGPQLERMIARPGLRRHALRANMEHGDRVPLEAAVALMRGVGETTAFDPFMKWVATADGFHGDVDVPCTLAWGAPDRVLPFKAYGRPMTERLPNARLVHLRGCGHVPMYDDPDLVSQTILETTQERP